MFSIFYWGDGGLNLELFLSSGVFDLHEGSEEGAQTTFEGQ